jgi:hypothetical protein
VKVRLVLFLFLFLFFPSCSNSNAPNLCERVVKEASDIDKVNKLWAVLVDAYDNVSDYEYGLGPDSIKITTEREFLINNDLRFIPIDWEDLGFFYGANYVLYYPSERIPNLGSVDMTDEIYIRSVVRDSLKKIEVGNESVRIRFYPKGESFSADVQCGRPQSKSTKVFTIN